MEISDAPWFAKVYKLVKSLSSWFERVGLVAMAAMALATLVDVFGSKGLHLPLPGSTEIIGVLQVAAIAGGLAYSKIDGRQIRVELLADFLPRRGKAALDVFSAILGLGLFVIIGWMTFKWALNLSGTETLLLGIPLAPFALWITLCSIPMCCVIIMELISATDRMLR
jgi:TRAP-type C4-dicarboxylate transport system permease small subunit